MKTKLDLFKQIFNFNKNKVMGNLAFYVVLKGKVKPLSTPHVNKHYMKLRVTTPEPIEPVKEVIFDDCKSFKF